MGDKKAVTGRYYWDFPPGKDQPGIVGIMDQDPIEAVAPGTTGRVPSQGSKGPEQLATGQRGWYTYDDAGSIPG